MGSCCNKCRGCCGNCKQSVCMCWEKTLALAPLALVLGAWPLMGIFKFAVFPQSYPYPLTIGMVSQLIVFLIGSILYAIQCFRRGFKCCGAKSDPDHKGPVTPLICCKRLFHWGVFPGLCLVIFLFAQYSVSDLCPDNPNLCTVVIRSPLFLFALIFLGINKAGRRGGRADWFVSILMMAGVSLLFWKTNVGLRIENVEDFQIVLAGIVISVSFGGFCLMLRKSTLTSGIKKVMWVISFYGTLLLLPLALGFEGTAPWQLSDIQEALKVGVLVGGSIIWMFCTVASAKSETICVALALHIGLVLGDFGMYHHITQDYQMTVVSGFGFVFLFFAFIWLLKRMLWHCWYKRETNPGNGPDIDPHDSLDTVVIPPLNPEGGKTEKTKLAKGDQGYRAVSVPEQPKPKSKKELKKEAKKAKKALKAQRDSRSSFEESSSWREDASGSESSSHGQDKKKKRASISKMFKKKKETS